MRLLVSLLVVAIVLLSAHALATGDGPADRTKLTTDQRLKALELEVEYLRAREAALTSYVLQNQERAAYLDGLAKRTRELGFTTNRIQISSRRALLGGLESFAAQMAEGLPERTAEQEVLLKRVEALTK